MSSYTPPRSRTGGRTAALAALALAAVTGTTLAATAPTALAASAPAAATAAAPTAAGDPVNCPSAGCRRAAEGLSNPFSVALDDEGSAYVADGNSGNLFEINPAAGEKHEVTTGLGNTLGVALDGEGHAYSTSHEDGKLYRVDLSSGQKTEVAHGLGTPHSVALDGNGKAFVTDNNNGRVWEIDLSNGHTAEVTTGLDNPHGIALDGEGHAYVGTYDDGKLYSVDLASGQKTVVADGLGTPNGVALSGGHAYVADGEGGKLVDVDLANGAKRIVATAGHFHGVAVGQDGGIYATDQTNKVLWRLNDAAQTPGNLDATVEQRKPASGKPGDRWVYPSVVVTNTGEKHIGKQQVTVHADKNLRFEDNRITLSRNGGEETHNCTRSADHRTLTCNATDLNLDPGDDIVAYPRTSITGAAQTGTAADVSFDVGSPAFASGDATVDVR